VTSHRSADELYAFNTAANKKINAGNSVCHPAGAEAWRLW